MRYMDYVSSGGSTFAINGNHIVHYIGASNGTWRTVTANLQADLREIDQTNRVLEVLSFSFEGVDKVDDIKLLYQ
jgi:hypothetical protein